MYAGNMSESFGHEYVQMFVRTKWSFLKSFISRNAMSITHFPAMPLALSATSSSYFVDRDLPLARSLFPSMFPWSKSGIRYVSARWNIGLSEPQRPASDRNLRQDSPLALVPLHSKHELSCNRHLRLYEAHQNVNILSCIIILLVIVPKTEALLRG